MKQTGWNRLAPWRLRTHEARRQRALAHELGPPGSMRTLFAHLFTTAAAAKECFIFAKTETEPRRDRVPIVCPTSRAEPRLPNSYKGFMH